MSNQLDTNTLVTALTDGIGAELGRAVRSSYYELLTRLSRHELFLRLDYTSRQQVIDVLALSMFYNTVIAPIESARSLLSLANKAAATHVRIGHDKITPALGNRFGSCAGAFRKILRTQQIPSDLLSFATLKDFMINVLNAKETAQREALDRSTNTD